MPSKLTNWRLQILYILGVYCLSASLSIVFDPTEKTGPPGIDYSVIGAYFVFGFLFLPIAIGFDNFLPVIFAFAFWPAVIFLVILFLKTKRWWYFVILSILLLLPSLNIAKAFVAAMGI